MSKAFNVNSFSSLGNKLGDETVAGEVCENRAFGGFTMCSMKKSPTLSLKTTGDLLCFRFEQTATSVDQEIQDSLVVSDPLQHRVGSVWY